MMGRREFGGASPCVWLIHASLRLLLLRFCLLCLRLLRLQRRSSLRGERVNELPARIIVCCAAEG